MWRPVKKENEELGKCCHSVGELKKILELIPDDYELSVIGTVFAMLVNDEDKVVLFDEVTECENILIEQEERG